jgi:hypothetical protein
VKIYQSRSFEKKVKKMLKQEKEILDQEVRVIAQDPSAGEEKKGDLAGVFVYTIPACLSKGRPGPGVGYDWSSQQLLSGFEAESEEPLRRGNRLLNRLQFHWSLAGKRAMYIKFQKHEEFFIVSFKER